MPSEGAGGLGDMRYEPPHTSLAMPLDGTPPTDYVFSGLAQAILAAMGSTEACLLIMF